MFEARSCLVLCCRRTSAKRKFYGIMRHAYSQLSGVRQCVKMKIFAAILFTFSVQFTSLISAQEFSFGRCGPFPTVKQFDPQRVSPEFSIYESVSNVMFFSILEDGLNIPIILPFSNFLANVSQPITEFYPAILCMATMWKLRSSIKLSIQCK